MIHHGADDTPAAAIKWYATCPAAPNANDPIADHFANRVARGANPPASHTRNAYAAYTSIPIGNVIDVSSVQSASGVPGNGWTFPNPVI